MTILQLIAATEAVADTTKKAVIECDAAPEWCTDGEFAGNISRAEIECLHGAVRILI